MTIKTKTKNKGYVLATKEITATYVYNTEKAYGSRKITSHQAKIDELYTQYLNEGDKYDVISLSASNKNNKNIKKYENPKTGTNITVYDGGAKKVMVYENGSELYSFAVTTDASKSLAQYSTTRGDIINSDKIVVEGETFFPVTERGFVGINHIKNLNNM